MRTMKPETKQTKWTRLAIKRDLSLTVWASAAGASSRTAKLRRWVTISREILSAARISTAYEYDNRDRLVLKTTSWSGGPVVSLNYAYDADGNLTNLWSGTSGGVTNAYQYDPLRRI